MSRRRDPYNFSPETKLEALRRYDFRCAISGVHKRDTPEGYLEVHHQVGIHYYLLYKEWFNSFGIDDDFIRSADNALPLCKEEHLKIHEQDSFEYYKQVAIALLGLARIGESA